MSYLYEFASYLYRFVSNGTTYNTVGTYLVKLVVSNSFGADSLTQTTYINVVNAVNTCQSTSTTAINGILYDSGGPTGDYSDNEDCTFLINPGPNCAITLTFNSFDVEFFWDFLYVYDGPNTFSPLLGTFTGTTLPPPVTATSGQMFIRFTSDFTITGTGYEALWSSIVSAPTAGNFQVSVNPTAFIPVAFTDMSANATLWFWNFGDATTSTLQNPTHIYAASGAYTVTEIVTNCISSDTTTQVINVSPNGIYDITNSGALSIYPNPFTSEIVIAVTDGQGRKNVTVEMFDVTGRKIRELKMTGAELRIERNDLSSGVYFIQVRNEDGIMGRAKVVAE